MDNVRYPIGYFTPISNLTIDERYKVITQISGISQPLRDIVKGLAYDQLLTPYRPGGWTIQQVVHHMADNDLNAYLRLKRALTEDEPEANSYREDLWAELSDYKDAPIETSLLLLEALHSRLVILLKGLGPDDFKRKLKTQALGVITVDIAIQRFVWHNQHHTAHIRNLIESKNWQRNFC